MATACPGSRGPYGDNEVCDITGFSGTLTTSTFNTESCCDKLTVNGYVFKGSMAANHYGTIVVSGLMTWRSDGSINSASGYGYTGCLDGMYLVDMAAAGKARVRPSDKG